MELLQELLRAQLKIILEKQWKKPGQNHYVTL